MKTILIVLFLSINIYSFGQYFEDISIETAYLTNFKTHSVDLGFNLDFAELFSNNMFLSLGCSYEYNFADASLFDTRVAISLMKRYVCHFLYGDYYPELQFVAHYKFNNHANKQYLIPEIAYNIPISDRLFITPNISYYISLKEKLPLNESIFVGLKLKIPLYIMGTFLKY